MRGRRVHRASEQGPRLVRRRTGEHDRRDQGFWRKARMLTRAVRREVSRTRILSMAAALAFYFMLSMVPMLVVFSSALKFLAAPHLFGQLLDMIAQIVPAYAMQFVERIVAGILRPNRATLLSAGILGYLWAGTAGFAALIEALDVAYDVPISRPWWRNRVRALLLALTSGALVAISLVAYIVGPHFLHFLQQFMALPPPLVSVWPLLRLVIAFVTFVIALELMYFLGPNVRHRFVTTLPGAVLAIAIWFAASWGLSFYLSEVSNYNATYGSMGAFVGLMVWFYLTGLAILLGAELNGEAVKYRDQIQHLADRLGRRTRKH